MSYAGPVSGPATGPGSRTTRADEAAPTALEPTALEPTAPTAGRSPAKSFRPLPRYSTRQDRTTTFAAGVALGLALGLGAALLLAPQSGAETRQDLVRRGRRIKRRTRSAWDDLRFELRQLQSKSFKRRDASSL